MAKIYRNKPLSSERVKEIAHREIQTREELNKKRLSEDQREKVRQDCILSAKKAERNR